MPDKAFNISKNPKYDGYKLWLALMIYKFFDKITCSSNTSQLKVKLCKKKQRIAKRATYNNYLKL